MLFFVIDLLLSLRNHAWHLRCVSARRIASSLSHVFQPWCFGQHFCIPRLFRLRAWLTWTSVSVGLRPFHGCGSLGSSSDVDGSNVSSKTRHETIHSNRVTSVLGGPMGTPIQSNPNPHPTNEDRNQPALSYPNHRVVGKHHRRWKGEAPPHASMEGPYTRRNKHACQTTSNDSQGIGMHAKGHEMHRWTMPNAWDQHTNHGWITIDDVSQPLERSATTTVSKP